MTKAVAKQIEYAVSTLAIEKLRPSDEAIKLCEQMAEGKISTDAAILAILTQHGVRSPKYNV